MPYYTPYNYTPNYMQNPYQQMPMPVPQTPPQPQPTYAQPSSGINWVSGEKEAMLYPVAPNTAIALWDNTAPKIYLKQSDASGKPTVKTYDLVEEVVEQEQPQTAPDYVTKTDFGSVVTAISAIKTDIDSIKKDLYGIAGKKTKPQKEVEE